MKSVTFLVDLEVLNVANMKCPNALGHLIFATFAMLEFLGPIGKLRERFQS